MLSRRRLRRRQFAREEQAISEAVPSGCLWEAIAEALAAIRMPCPEPVPLTIDTHDAALRIASRYRFHIYDALVVAAALEAECTTLHSEDLQTDQVIDGTLTIRNPFMLDGGNAQA